MLRNHGDSRRRVTLAQKVGNQPADPTNIYDDISPEELDILMLNAAGMANPDFNPSVKGEGDLSSDDVMGEYSDFGARDVNEMYSGLSGRLTKSAKEDKARKSGSGEGMRGFEQFSDAGMGEEIPEGVISDVMEPSSESEDLIYGTTEAPSRGAEGGKEGAREDVRSGRPISGGKESEDIYDVLGGGGKPKAIIKEKEKTAVIPGGMAKNPFPEDSKLGKMFRAIEARGKPKGHGLGQVRRPRF
jgi:hypothetical protein